MSDPKKPMPREFYSEYEERPFQACSRCGESLSTFDNYQINKAYRNGECVFEFAFCATCRDSLIDEFSEESKTNLMRYQEQHLKQTGGTAECAFCGTSKEKTPMRDYIISAIGAGLDLLDSVMICESCQMAMHELLSEKTRDVRRRFFEDLPGVPPDWEVWTPEEMEANKLITTAKTKHPSVKPQLTGQWNGNPEARHPMDDGCSELVWEIRGPLLR